MMMMMMMMMMMTMMMMMRDTDVDDVVVNDDVCGNRTSACEYKFKVLLRKVFVSSCFLYIRRQLNQS